MLNLPYAYFYSGNAVMPGSFQYGAPAIYPVNNIFKFIKYLLITHIRGQNQQIATLILNRLKFKHDEKNTSFQNLLISKCLEIFKKMFIFCVSA